MNARAVVAITDWKIRNCKKLLISVLRLRKAYKKINKTEEGKNEYFFFGWMQSEMKRALKNPTSEFTRKKWRISLYFMYYCYP